ncbi:probable cytochrome P450 312a1 [Drosophila navojoa]|uniref:probable cytochrome P450 312a1 n=1 Tax=Drosophila navojoa TaxID=7232 RepID=UPI000846E854|nr:probable cytochrome P450 312a1 [Drosophila navojoa]
MLVPVSMWLLLLGVVLAYLIHSIRYQARINRLTSNWPGPPSLPILGHLHIFAKIIGPRPFKRAAELINCHLQDHRGKLWLGTKLYILDCNPKDIQALCSAKQLLQKTSDYRVFENWLGAGVFTSRVDKWMHSRKMIAPTFNYSMVKQFVHIFERQARILLDRLATLADTDQPVDFFQFISCCTLDTICETALGTTVNSQSGEKSEYLDAVREIFHVFDTRLKNLLYRYPLIYYFTPLAARERQLLKILHGFTKGIVTKRLAQLASDLANGNNEATSDAESRQQQTRSLLDNLLLARGADGQPLKEREIREEVDTIIFGGFDLTAAMLKFFMYNMTLHVEYQQQCREEIWRVCGRDAATAITIEQMRELVYLEMCIKETLRMYPSAPITARRATANCTINNFFIPKGSDVIISPMYMGRCKEFFPEPLVFRPQRWARDAQPKIEPSTYIPFMTGPRSCLGQRYAMVMLKLVLAHLLRSFYFEPLGERQEKARLIFVMTLHTKDPYYCKIRAVK